nr:FG-GAP-like repeat-containing protein [Prochlorococcus marinus]
MTVTLSEETTNTVTVEYTTSNNQLNFAESIITTSVDGAYDVHVADIDRDGDMDIIASSMNDDTIRWFENNGNENPSFTSAVIATTADGARGITVVDIDGDGDLDIVSASADDDTIAWYENDGAANPTFTAADIATNADGAHDVKLADIDGDGDLDIISASPLDDTIAWYENDGAANPSFTAADIATSADGATSVFLVDLDSDGDIDILSSSYHDDTIAWYENDGAANPTFTAADIATNIDGAYFVYAQDMDADGDIDILAASILEDKVVLLKNNGAANPTFNASDIITSIKPFAVDVNDIDGDGDLDIGIAAHDGLLAATSADKVAWFSSDGASSPSWTFVESTINPKNGVESIFTADLDGDGDLDGVSASFKDDTIAWYENLGTSNNIPANRIAQSGEDYSSVSGVLTFEPGTTTATIIIPITNDKLPENIEDFTLSLTNPTNATLTNESAKISINANDQIGFIARDIVTNANGAENVYVADMDGDGDLDIVSASIEDDTIAWYENNGSANPTFTKSVVATSANGAEDVHVADIDGDGDLDIVSASREDSTIAWYENNGAADPSWTAADIATSANGAQRVFVADMDGDGDLDIVSGSYFDDTIAWYENNGAANPSWASADIATSADGAHDVYVADMDGDGDMDIVSASYLDDTIAWYENDGAANPSWTSADIVTNADGANDIFLVDLDGDGDMDIISASELDDTIAWYESDGAANPSWTKRVIATSADGAGSVFAADIDGDGDLDVASASINDDTIAWYINDGANDPSFTAVDIATNADNANSVFVADLDGDGDLDIVSSSYIDDTIAWYENVGATRISISDVTTSNENAANASITVSLNQTTDEDVTVAYATSNGTATAGADYTATSGTLTISAGATSGTFNVPVLADSLDENNETVNITLTNPTNASISDSTATLTITDDDATPSITIADLTTSNENASNATFTVSLSNASSQDITLDYATSNGTATAGSDYTATSGTLTISAGATSGTFNVPVLADSLDEVNETATITLSNASNASISDSTATLTITDDDAAPTLSFNNINGSDQYGVQEQNANATVDIRLSAASAKTITVDYATTATDSFPTFTASAISNDSAKDIVLADLDGDGDLDIISSGGWYENDGAANPSFSDRGVVGNESAVHVADIDSDGDLDIVAAYEHTDTIRWYENDGAANPSFSTTVITTSADYAHDVYIADIDGDGDLDIISASNNDDKIAWYENDGAANPTFTTSIIATNADEAREVFIGDVDNDGDLDIVSASRTDGAIAWYENDGAANPSFTSSDIVNSLDGSGGKTDVHLADIDGDGDLDIVAADYDRNPVVWYENDGAANPSWTAQSIVGYPDTSPTSQHIIYGVGVHVDDVDNDGDLDIISAVTAGTTKVAWYENDGAPNPGWTARDIDISNKGFYEVASGDLDNDGDIDFLSAASSGGITWYESDVASNNDTAVMAQVDDDYTATSGSVTFSPGETLKTFTVAIKEDQITENQQESVQLVLSNPTNATLGDSSGVLLISDDDGISFTESIISTSADGAYDVHVADMDSDGDMDIVASSIHDDTIRWFENDGNVNPSFTAATIATNADHVREITVADMDGDGDLDILSASENDDSIAWYENNGAADPTFTKAVIATSADGAQDVQVADMDGDGDLDIVSASSLDDTIAWYENDGASNPSWAAANIATNADGATSVFLIDLDKDGDIDILSSSYNDDTIAWYENNGAANPTFTAADIATNIDGAYHVYAEDMDADGDIDILASAAIGDKVVLFKSNGAADPTFTASDIIKTTANDVIDTPIGLDVKDIDGDGDLDIGIALNDGLNSASSADRVAWYASDGAASPSWTLIQSTSNAKNGVENVFIADIDGDGDLDGVSASHNDDTIAWYENHGAASSLRLSIADVTTSNENAANAIFTVSLSGGPNDLGISPIAPRDITVDYATSNGTATAGADYTATSGTLIIEAGTNSGTFNVPVLADTNYEGNETATITLSNASNASISDSTATLTITDDDSAPSITIADVTTSNENASNATFTVTLSGTSTVDVTVAYATSNGTATAGSDYTATSGTLTISAGATSGTFNVPVLSDTTDENNETATITLSNASNASISDSTATLTITDDDAAPTIEFNDGSNSDVFSITEQTGTKTVTVALSAASAKTITIDYATTATDSFPTWTPIVVASNADGASDVHVADMDGDGDLDIVSASYNDDTIAWYENNGAANPSFTAADIATSADFAVGVFIADMDGDGDLDIVSASELDNTIAWYENDGAADPTWTAADIATSAQGASQVYVADMDSDGDLDIVSSSKSDHTIAWYENNGAADPAWTAADIATSASFATDVHVADMDGDGDMDIVSASYNDDTIAWYENNGAADPAWTAADIATDADYAQAVYVDDLDGDGDLDIVSASMIDNTIAWYENNGAVDPTWTAANIATNAEGAMDVYIGDLDHDGDLDIVSASQSDNTIAWYENNGAANPSWSSSNITTNVTYALKADAVHLADIDNDGDLDIISAAYEADTIAWYESDVASNNDTAIMAQAGDDYTATSGTLTFSPGETSKTFTVTVAEDLIPENNETVQLTLSNPSNTTISDATGSVVITDDDVIKWDEFEITTSADGAYDVHVADMDSDGDMDIVASSIHDDTIRWFENNGNINPTWTATTIVTNADHVREITVADMDNDGDLDILSASQNDSTIAWYENDGAADPTWTKGVIATSASLANDVQVADLDGDGDLDIVSASVNDDTIAWYENDGAANPTWTAADIATDADGATSVFLIDLDKDGDIDILSSSYEDDTIAWYENNGAANPTFTAADIATNIDGAYHVYAKDMDADGDIDILASAAIGDKVVLFKSNGAADPTFTASDIITSFDTPIGLDVADVDFDGDLDIGITGNDGLNGAGATDLVAWYSSDGAANPTWTLIDKTTSLPNGAENVFFADIDGDGDIDAASASHNDDTIVWYENLGPAQNHVLSIADVTTSNENAANATFTVNLSNASPRDITLNYETIDTTSTTFTGETLVSNVTNAEEVQLGDMDGDGDLDIVYAGLTNDTFGWLENNGSSWSQASIDTSADGAKGIHIADIDGDGDLDFVGAMYYGDSIAWYENDGAANPSFTKTVISTGTDGANDIHVGDIDGDGDLDIISASGNDDEITWFENNGAADPTFATTVIATSADNPHEVFIADMDSDGDLDIISTSVNDSTVAWYENNGAADPSFAATNIATNVSGAHGIHVDDMDADGDMDIVIASFTDDTVRWYENNGAADPTWSAANIATSIDGARDIEVLDLDKDGDLDVMVTAQDADSISYWLNNGAADPSWSGQNLFSSEFDKPHNIAIGDVDNDGYLDVVSSSHNDHKIALHNVDQTATAGSDYTSTSGTLKISAGATSGTFTIPVLADSISEAEEVVTVKFTRPSNAFVSPTDGLSDSNNYVTTARLTITDDDALTFTASDIATSADGAQDVKVADMDGDGDLDIVSASPLDDTIAWYENDGAANPTFTAANIYTSATEARNIHIVDLDGDGDLDIVGAGSGNDVVGWLENDGAANPTFSNEILATSADGAHDVYVADLDGDGDLDIVSASINDDTIAWYENNGAADPSFTAADIATNADYALGVHIADMDGDGDLDIVSASQLDDTIAWYENDGAANPTFTAADIATSADHATSLYVADMDGDGDMDILSSSENDDTIAWYENDGAANPTFTAADIATSADGAWSVKAADMDGDGDLDIISASFNDDTIAWYENNGAADPAWTATDIATSADGARAVTIADIDGDGDLDIISASANDDTIAWYENNCDGNDPLIFDLDNDGIELISTKEKVLFDVDVDGDLEITGWTAPDDGLLVMDINNDGFINDMSEVFSEHFNSGAFISSLDSLNSIDSNNDDLINYQDELFEQVMIWQDLNSNGISNSGELSTLNEVGIESISLLAEIMDDEIEGNTINAKGSYEGTDGVTREFVQAIFTSEDLENIQENDSFFEDELILGNQEFDSFERISLDSGYELNNLDTLGGSDIDYEKQPIFEDLNNQLLASFYEEPELDTQEQVKVSI